MTTHFTAEAEPHFTLAMDCSGHLESDEVEIHEILLPRWAAFSPNGRVKFDALYPTDRAYFQQIANAEWERVKAAQLEAARGRDEP